MSAFMGKGYKNIGDDKNYSKFSLAALGIFEKLKNADYTENRFNKNDQ